MTGSTSELAPARPGGGLPASLPVRRSATVTVAVRDGEQVTVSSWETCTGVASFVATLLGPPGLVEVQG